MAKQITYICWLSFLQILHSQRMVGSLKSVSSRLIRRDYPDHVAKFYWKPVFWTSAYCVITAGGAPLDVLKQYIQNQNEPEPISGDDSEAAIPLLN